MKTIILFLTSVVVSINLIAQKINEGVYLSAADFTTGKISYINSQNNEKYKFYIHDGFNTSLIKIIIGNSVIKLNKDSIFGYRDKKNIYYRFFNKNVYKLINPSEQILLYSRTFSEGGFRNNHSVTNYFFSANANASIYPLSKWNLKKVFYTDIRFLELLDIYFDCDNELISYDIINKIYNLNRIYELSKQVICINK